MPVGAFAALAAPGLVDGPGTFPARILGAIAAAVVISRVSPYWTALLAGMGVFWLVTAIT